MTTREATLKAFEALPPGKFDGIYIIAVVRRTLGRPQMYADTILRSLRTLRQKKTINYVSEIRSKSKYIKR